MKENGPRTDESRGGSSQGFGRQFHRALASRERRRLLAVLLDGGERQVEEVATLLVGWDATEFNTVEGPADHRRVLIRLHHVHLPMLDDAGLVTHDTEDGTVRIGSLDPATVELIERSVDAVEHRP